MKKREIWLADAIDAMASAKARAEGVDVSTYYAGLISDHLLNVLDVNVQERVRELENQLDTALETVASASTPSGRRSDRNEVLDVEQLVVSGGTFRKRYVAGYIRDPNDPDRPYTECEFAYLEKVGSGKGDAVLTDNTGDDPKSSPPIAGTFERVPTGEGDYLIGTSFDHLSFDVAKQFPGFPIQSIRYAQEVVNAATRIPGVVAKDYTNKAGDRIGIAFKPNFLMIEALLQRKSGIRVSLYGEPDQFKNKPSALGPGRGRYSRVVVTTSEDLQKLLPLVHQAYELKLGAVPEEEDYV